MRRLLLPTLLGLSLGAGIALPRAGRALDLVPCDTRIDLSIDTITVDGNPVAPASDTSYLLLSLSTTVHQPGGALTSTLYDPDLDAELVQTWQVAP